MAAETLRNYAATWLETIRPTVRHTTIRAYDQALRVRAFPVLGDTPIDQISRTQLKGWFAGLLEKYKPGTAHHTLVTLHTLLACAVEDEEITVNPAASLRRAMRAALRNKRDSHRPPLSREQLMAFLESASCYPEQYPGMVLLAYTGLRIGEAIGLQWSDLDFDRKTIRVQRQVYPNGMVGSLKTGSARTIPMADRLSTVLRAVKTERSGNWARYNVTPSPWVLFPDLLTQGFTSNMARKCLEQAVKRTLKRAGLPLTFSCHSLRHTIATILVEQGAPLKFVQNLLGHASITITADRYARSADMSGGAPVERFSLGLEGVNSKGPLTGGKKDA